jgi:hypothetical protein
VGNPAVRVLLKDAPAAGETLAALPGALSARAGAAEGGWIIEHEKGADLREAVFRAAVEHGWVLLEMMRERASMEDVFVRLTTHDVAASSAEEAHAEEAPAAPQEPDEPVDAAPSDETPSEETPS